MSAFRVLEDEKKNWAEHRALWYAMQPFCRARHGKRKMGVFVLWLSLIRSDVAKLGSLPHGEYQDCVCVC